MIAFRIGEIQEVITISHVSIDQSGNKSMAVDRIITCNKIKVEILVIKYDRVKFVLQYYNDYLLSQIC